MKILRDSEKMGTFCQRIWKLTSKAIHLFLRKGLVLDSKMTQMGLRVLLIRLSSLMSSNTLNQQIETLVKYKYKRYKMMSF